MKVFTYGPRATQSRSFTGLSVLPCMLALFVIAALVMLVGGAAAAVTAVPLGTSDSFAVLAGAGITNTGPTTVGGDIGTFPTTSESGTASVTQTGTNHAGDAVTQQAQNDLTTAYNTAAGEGPTSPIGPGSAIVDLGGQTLSPGVYNSASSVGLTGALTLNAGGDPNAVFVFQAGSTLTTASASQINLINGAQSCNVFWQVGSSATLGTGSSFVGSILALTDITVTTDVTVDGRVLAQNGAVTLDTDTITAPACAAPTTTTGTTTGGATTTPTPALPAPAVTAVVVVSTTGQAAAAQAAAAQTTATNAAAAAKAAAARAAAAKAAAEKAAKAANAKATRALALKAAAAAKLAATNALTAKTAAKEAAAAAKLAAEQAAATKLAAAKAAAAKAAAAARSAAAEARAASLAAEKAAASARAAAAKIAAARELAARETATERLRGQARPALRHVGLTG